MVCLFRIFQRFLFLRNHHRSPDADEQYEDDEYQRTDCINLEEIVDEHLHTDEHQQHTHTHLQIAELVCYRCQQEEEGTQAQDGEDIREEHHERVERYREYGWDAVEGENQITELDEHHRHHQRTQMQALLHELHYRMLQGIDLFLLVSVEEHLGTAVNQESSEYE